jgi:NADPH-dependent curcumin reductase
VNLQWILARKPPGGLPVDEDFKLVEAPTPEPGANQMLTRTIYLSLDPYQWGRRRSGLEAVGEVCHGRTVSQVVKSNLSEYDEGDFIFNTNGWQTYGLTGEGISVLGYMFPRKLDPAQGPISTAVGIMGMLGLTAYSGMVLQCQPRAGETVVVSAASGGVGQVAGQLAKIRGCRVVGIAGVKEKCDFVVSTLGFDACVSHKSATLAEDLKAACRDGIDAYFENVGGQVFAAVLLLLNQGARISLCGLVSQYGSATQGDPHDAWMAAGAPTFVRDHQAHFFDQMAGWIREGKVKYKEDLWPGLEQAPKTFRAMLEGGNFGKTLVGVGEDPTLIDALKSRRAGANVLRA